MAHCTVRGTGQFHAMPEEALKEIKSFVMKLCVPHHTPMQMKFKMTWKSCIEAIGQAFKSLRGYKGH